MNFEWALHQLKEGRKLRRKTMKYNAYIHLLGNTLFMGFEDGGSQSYGLQFEDVTSEDWELFQETRDAVVKTEASEYYHCPYCTSKINCKKDENYHVCWNCGKRVKLKRKEKIDCGIDLTQYYSMIEKSKLPDLGIIIPSLEIDEKLKPGEYKIVNKNPEETIVIFKMNSSTSFS